MFADQRESQVVELNIRSDHVHLIIKVPPKVSISRLMGTLKGRSAIRVLKQFPQLKQKPSWGNPFWARGYCVDTIGLDGEMIRKYVAYQERLERKQERAQDQLGLF